MKRFFFSCFLSFFLQWKGVSQRQASSSVIRFEALAIGLQRLSALLSKTLDKDGRQADSLKIGTYVPYRVDSETCKVFVMCIRSGSRVGVVVRALAFHQCVPGSIPGPGVICGLSLLVHHSAPRGFSPGTPVFPSPQKPTFDLI